MKFIRPADISGRIAAPASKSVMQRALFAASLSTGTSEIRSSPGWCDDTLAALSVVEGLGARAERTGNGVLITGRVCRASDAVSCGESGLCFRMTCAVAALADTPVTIEGHGSLLRRPMTMVESSLASLGASCRTNGGLPPVIVQGPLRGGRSEIDGSVSSQFLTGLLTALPCCDADSELRVRDLKSKPYIDLTLEVLSKFGLHIERDSSYSNFLIPGRQQAAPAKFIVEGDWSGAACLLVAGAVAGRVEISGLDPASTQADREILAALALCGASVAASPASIRVAAGELRPFEFVATDCPDLFPALAALAACCRGRSRIFGAHRLVHKESNRLRALCEEFSKVGVRISAEGDALEIEGGAIAGGSIDSRGDHRIAMAGAILGLVSTSGVHIEGESSVAKSYPGFFDDLVTLTGQGKT